MPQEELQLADWMLVPDILKILETDFPDSLASSRHLEFSASCKKTGDAILLTPGGKVDKYATFVAYVHQFNYGTFYSLNPDYKEMKSLLKSKLVPWNKGPIWNRIHEKFQPALDELYEEWNMKQLISPFIGDSYLVDINEAKKITYTCPPEVYIGPLKEEHAELIDSYWAQRDEKSVNITKFMIGRNGGLGLYLKESNELIAWCLIWVHNGPGHHFVIDQHRRKGYGTLVAKAITKLLAEKGIQPMICIQIDNAASQELWQRIGYKKLYRESNELIAWCLIWAHNGPGKRFVTDQHKRKGYGLLLVKAISKLLAEKGIQPACGIHKDSIASQELF